MHLPDFASCSANGLDQKDLLFLFEHFPVAGVDPVEAVRRVHEQPSTLESIFESRFVQDALLARDGRWLEVSPRLFFNIMLRRVLRERRTAMDRQVIHYLGNLLGCYATGDRLYRLQPEDEGRYEYLADLVQAGLEAGPERRFLVDAQIGNYALYLSGLCASWVAYRRDYRRRPVSIEYYRRMGRNHYAQAAVSLSAERFGLREVFGHLARRFEYFRDGMQQLAQELFPARRWANPGPEPAR